MPSSHAPAGADRGVVRTADQTVLVADDDPDIQTLVVLRLERSGYRVLRASDGQEALDLALTELPDLAVLDITMPKLDGCEVTRTLRADARTADMPVILLTARVQDDDVVRGLEAGATDYVKKPFSPQELGARITSLLG
jgi:DNA-binding response OmpR family regulator